MRWILLLLLCVPFSCTSQPPEIYGHRGWRAKYPENSVIGFQEVLKLPIDGVEWDVVVNADSQLVLSHEPFFHPNICCSEKFSKGKNQVHNNLFKLNQSEILQIPCGCKKHPDFPNQISAPHTKPLLKEVFEQCSLQGKTVLFEIKSNVHDYGTFQPNPEEYAKIIIQETNELDSAIELVFMSFELLVYKPMRRMKHVLAPLNFKPEGIACYHLVLNKKSVQRVHNEGLKCLAWTVNAAKKARKLKKWKIDGIISDEPNTMQLATQ